MMEIFHYIETITGIITPLIFVPLFKLQSTLTEIKVDIAKLKQQTGVN